MSGVAVVSVGDGPRGFAVSPDKSLVYVANSLSNTISLLRTWTGGGQFMNPYGVSASAGTLFVSANGAALRVNASTGVVQATASVLPNVRGLALDPVGGAVWVNSLGCACVRRFNASNLQASGDYYVGGEPDAILFVSK